MLELKRSLVASLRKLCAHFPLACSLVSFSKTDCAGFRLRRTICILSGYDGHCRDKFAPMIYECFAFINHVLIYITMPPSTCIT